MAVSEIEPEVPLEAIVPVGFVASGVTVNEEVAVKVALLVAVTVWEPVAPTAPDQV